MQSHFQEHPHDHNYDIFGRWIGPNERDFGSRMPAPVFDTLHEAEAAAAAAGIMSYTIISHIHSSTIGREGGVHQQESMLIAT